MGQRVAGSILRRDGVYYARVTLHREPKRGGRHPRAEVRVFRLNDKPITEAFARLFAAQKQADYDEGRWSPEGTAPAPCPSLAVAAWVAQWCARQTYTTAAQDARRVAHYLDGSALADLAVKDVTPRDVAAWLAYAHRKPSARKTPPAERTVRNAYDVLRRALAGAVFEGMLAQDPCAVLPSEVTPRAVDAHPERRRDYRLARHEVEALLGDDGTPDDRLVRHDRDAPAPSPVESPRDPTAAPRPRVARRRPPRHP